MTTHFPCRTFALLLLASVALTEPMWSQTEEPPPPPEPSTVNARAGLELFPAEGLLWEKNDTEIATHLGWPEESRTSASSSFRSYLPVEVFGRRAFSMVLHGEEEKPVSLSFVFANKGDIDAMMNIDSNARESDLRREQSRVMRDYKRIIADDARALRETLTELLGEPKTERTGGSSQTSETGQRWDWQGHTFFLTAPRGEYVTLRIVPTAALDESGIERVSRGDLRTAIAGRVQRSDHGDVVITDIPMVDQGPKGYCVPATWERALRYMGIPADMYVLAMAGNTDVGGGTNIRDIEAGARQLVQRHGRRINSERGKISLNTIARTIDAGIPIMWAMFSTEEFNEIANSRTRDRAGVTDWEAWKTETLLPAKRAARNLKIDPEAAHVCMIIGYNKETGEVAVSDSWGSWAALRWVLFEEAEAISQGLLTTIQP